VTAETKGVSLLRVGHPFMQALESLVRSDDRGAAFAMWRYVPGWRDAPQPLLRFDFVIEADVFRGRAERVAVSTAVLRRRADAAFPVRYFTIWLTSDLEEVTQAEWLALLSRPYSKWPRPDGGRDFNLRPERWDRAAQLVAMGDWSELCVKARKEAEKLIRNQAVFRTECQRYSSRVLDSAATIANAFSSRKARLSGAVREAEERTAEMEAKLAEALAAGIQDPAMRVDSAGVVIISGDPLETE